MKIWRGGENSYRARQFTRSHIDRLLGSFWGRELKVSTPRLMRTEAVLVLQYIPLRIHLRGERHGGKLQASDLHGLNSLSLLQAAGGSQDGGVLREEVDGPGRRALPECVER